jgi:hypothetical protein
LTTGPQNRTARRNVVGALGRNRQLNSGATVRHLEQKEAKITKECKRLLNSRLNWFPSLFPSLASVQIAADNPRYSPVMLLDFSLGD